MGVSLIGLIAIVARVIREITQTIDFSIQIQVIAVFIIDFSRICCACS